MGCDLCNNFPTRALRQLNDDIEGGELSVAELAEKHYVSVPMLNEHIQKCVSVMNNVGHELLHELLGEIRRVAEDRKAQYEYDPDANAQGMTHYVNLMREARELVVAMERIRPSDELTEDVVEKILSPLVRQTILLIAEEAKKLREELAMVIDETQYQAMDKAVKRMLERFGARLETETENLVERLQKLLASPIKRKPSKKPADSNPSQDPSLH
jgi:hypothetical protein